MEYATRQRATNAFLEQEVFNTRHRTGILLFVSIFEHEVIIMVDRGIGKVVEQKVWDTIVRDLTRTMRNGKLIDGLELSIKRCGEILQERGFTEIREAGNELHDDLRTN
jgi:putative membrane protein